MERMSIMTKFDKGTALDTKDLENVAGGTYFQSVNVCSFLKEAGFGNVVNENGTPNFDGMRAALGSMGITSHDHGGLAMFGAKNNTYTMGNKTLSQDDLMKVLQDKFPNVQYNKVTEI